MRSYPLVPGHEGRGVSALRDRANQGTTHLATFRAIAKKYPDRPAAGSLCDLIASGPGAEGEWFAAAKDAGLLDLAASLALRSPTDPRTLTRAARDFAGQAPAFAVTCGTAALHWMAAGFGHEITGGDVLDAYSALSQAALASGMTRDELNRRLREQFAASLRGIRSSPPCWRIIWRHDVAMRPGHGLTVPARLAARRIVASGSPRSCGASGCFTADK